MPEPQTYTINVEAWRRAYLIGDRSEMRLTVGDSISTPGIVKFYARKRVFGSVLNDEAVRLLGLG